MAKNKIRDLLNTFVPKPKRSTFDRSHTNPFTADVGYIYPVLVDELLPSDYVNLDLMTFVQTNPLTKPLLGRFTLKFEAFFVPTRLYCQALDLNNSNPDFNYDFELPRFYIPSGSEILPTDGSLKETDGNGTRNRMAVGGTSLLCYLNMLPAGYSVSEENLAIVPNGAVNGIPFVGYYDIFRNNYWNPQDQYVPFRVRNLNESASGLGSFGVMDYYYPISCFDQFVSSVTRGSISSSGQPVSVDVWEYFRDAFSAAKSTTGNTTMAPPLMNGQLFSAVNETGVPSGANTGKTLHLGLLRRTYNDDYFTAYFSNDFVNYQETTARVVVGNNVFSVSQLRLANRVAKFVDRNGLGDTRYGSFLEVHFGVKTDNKLCIPQFLGSLRIPIVFNDVVSQAQTSGSMEPASVNSNQSLGSRASLGQGFKDFNRKGSWLRFEAKEHGYLMIMASIVPDVCYCRGIPKMYLKTRFADLYTPEYDAVGYQDLSALEYDVSLGNTALAQQPSWFEYMVDYNKAHGLFLDNENYRQWLLLRDPQFWNRSGRYPAAEDLNQSLGTFSTYILPELYNQVFDVQKEMDNFQVQLRFDYRIKRPISKQVLPRM